MYWEVVEMARLLCMAAIGVFVADGTDHPGAPQEGLGWNHANTVKRAASCISVHVAGGGTPTPRAIRVGPRWDPSGTWVGPAPG